MPNGERKPFYVLGNGIGSGMEAIALVSGLVLNGVFDRHPNLKIAMLECGVGLAPWIASRLDMLQYYGSVMQSERGDVYGRGSPISKTPSDYVKKHFWWTIDNVYETSLATLIRGYGLGNRLLAQTDFPHPEGSLDVFKWINEMDISDVDKKAILGRNACEPLGI